MYIRRGSSTSVANPDEIARMGGFVTDLDTMPTPQLVIEWADIEDRNALPSPCKLQSLRLTPRLHRDTFKPPDRRLHPFSGLAEFQPGATYNSSYSEEVIAYVGKLAFFSPLGLRLRNDGNVVGRRIRLIGSVSKSHGVVIRTWLPERPELWRYLSIHPTIEHNQNAPDLWIEDFDDRWEITVDFGDIRPREEVWTSESLYIGSRLSGAVGFTGMLLGDNLPEPIPYALEIHFEAGKRPMLRADVEPYLDPELRRE